MPRTVELTGCTIGLRAVIVPAAGDDGMLVHDAAGQPKTTERLQVFVADVQTGDVTTVPMTDAMFAEFAQIICARVADDGLRRQLIETLTGGIAVPSNVIAMPPGAARR
jgi:hypothetical protein